MTLLLPLLAAALYGASDFLGGLISRRAHYVWVGLVGQVAAATGSIVAALALASPLPGPNAILWGIGAGIGGAVGTMALYRGLAAGRMNVAGPLSAVGAAGIPVLVDVVLGHQLTLAALIGVGVAIPGIWLVSSESGSRSRAGGVGEGLLAGLGFAALFVCLHQAGDAAGLWPVAVGQVTAVVVLGAFALRSAKGVARPSWQAIWPGILGVSATILYFLAAREGTLAIAAVITSLYPAFTVLLAGLVLRERTTLAHGAGLLLCAASIGAFVAG